MEQYYALSHLKVSLSAYQYLIFQIEVSLHS